VAFTEDDAREVLARARAFYKGQLKSENKMYRDVSTEKHRRRNAAFYQAKAILRQHRERWPGLGSARAYGEYLARWNSFSTRVGNCGEMSALAVYFALDMTPEGSITARQAHTNNGHHSFAIVIPSGAEAPPDGTTVEGMQSANMSGIFVIDPWLNVACDAAEYYIRSLQKLWEWRDQGKVIGHAVTVGADGIPMPTIYHNHAEWCRILGTTPLRFTE
jgi:hypothetical protein